MRPIDADALMQSLEESCHALRSILEEPLSDNDRLCAKWQLVSFLENKMRVRNSPTITLDDLRPHGRWIPFRGGIDRQCSECNWSADFKIPRKFCPNCGAQMDGGDTHE